MQVSRKVFALTLTLAILLSSLVSCVVFEAAQPTAVKAEAPPVLAVSISPEGSSFQLGVGTEKTFTASANGSNPTFTWHLAPTGSFNLTVNGQETPLQNASELTFCGENLALKFPYAVENEFVNVYVSAVDDNGAQGKSDSIMIADPYTSPGFKFDGSVASAAVVCRPDGLGWYRAYDGKTGAKISALDSIVADTTLDGALAAYAGKTVYVDGGAWTGASLVVPANTVLIADPSTTGIKYTSIGAGARIDEPDFNAAFGGYSGGSYTVVTNQSAVATSATWYLAFKPDSTIVITSIDAGVVVQQAYDALPNYRGEIAFGNGPFNVATTIHTVSGTYDVRFQGTSLQAEASRLVWTGVSNGYIFNCSGTQSVTFNNLDFDAANLGHAIWAGNGGGIIINGDRFLRAITPPLIYVEGVGSSIQSHSSFISGELRLENRVNTANIYGGSIYGVFLYATNNGTGSSDPASFQMFGGTIQYMYVDQTSNYAVSLDGVYFDPTTELQNLYVGNGGYVYGFSATNCVFNGGTTNSVVIDKATNTRIINPVFINNGMVINSAAYNTTLQVQNRFIANISDSGSLTSLNGVRMIAGSGVIMPPIIGNSQTTRNMTNAGTAYGWYVNVPSQTTIDGIIVNMGTATGNIILGIYGPVSTTSYEPGGASLVAQTASVAANTGARVYSITPITIPPGRYALVVATDTATTNTYYGAIGIGTSSIQGFSFDIVGGYGVLPATAPASGAIATMPILSLHYSATSGVIP